MSEYPRAAIVGTLTTVTYLHVGSGGEERRRAGDDTMSFNTLLRDARERPYLPASSLRGRLRSRVRDPALRERIFGLARQPGDAEEPGDSGRLRVYDALAVTGDEVREVTRTAIDLLTGAAKEHHLAGHEVVAPGAVFRVHLELDRAQDEDIGVLLRALGDLDRDVDGGIGKGRSIGQGRMAWAPGGVRILRRERLIAWLRQGVPAAQGAGKRAGKSRSRAAGGTRIRLPDPGLEALWEEWEDGVELSAGASRWESLSLALLPAGPILINDPHLVQQRRDAADQAAKEAGGAEEQEPERTPDAVFMRGADGTACIPASTLKGWMRGQCRRILLSLSPGHESEPVERMLAALFGSTDQGRGCLQLEDALADFQPSQVHRQTFNAVDRFTGGVKPSALYWVEAVWPEAFHTRLHVRVEALEGWMELLLCWLLRDAEEGDLVLGWGKSKGYGRLRLQPGRARFRGDRAAPETLQEWHRALLDRLSKEVPSP